MTKIGTAINAIKTPEEGVGTGMGGSEGDADGAAEVFVEFEGDEDGLGVCVWLTEGVGVELDVDTRVAVIVPGPLTFASVDEALGLLKVTEPPVDVQCENV